VLLSVLYGSIVTNIVDFDGDLILALAAQLLGIAEEGGTTGSLLTAHRLMSICLLYTGHFVESQPHLQRTLALYDPAEHRALATRFGQDARAHTLCYRSLAFWLLGFPGAALADASHAVKDGRDVSQAGTLMNTLAIANLSYILCGNYAAARSQADELVNFGGRRGLCLLEGTWRVDEWLAPPMAPAHRYDRFCANRPYDPDRGSIGPNSPSPRTTLSSQRGPHLHIRCE
jgi:hypothetical protein